MAFACKLCIMRTGLRGSEISGLPQTEEELAAHMERDHHIIVTRDGETEADAQARFLRAYPDAATCAECRDAGAPWATPFVMGVDFAKFQDWAAAPPQEEK